MPDTRQNRSHTHTQPLELLENIREAGQKAKDKGKDVNGVAANKLKAAIENDNGDFLEYLKDFRDYQKNKDSNKTETESQTDRKTTRSKILQTLKKLCLFGHKN
jgi:hypothetical protein